ncbi:hypothetical protein ACS0TY_013591 [Phlomoides rotata]
MELTNAVGQTGVCYGKLANNLAAPSDVLSLYNQKNIYRMRTYNPHPQSLQPLRCSNIDLMLRVANSDLQNLAASHANAWVQTNVRSYPTMRFRYITVRNELSGMSTMLSLQLGLQTRSEFRQLSTPLCWVMETDYFTAL